jgi:hypothetical protein
MSITKSFVLLTFLLVIAADVLGLMVNSGMSLSHAHATIGLLAAITGLVSVIMVFRGK